MTIEYRYGRSQYVIVVHAPGRVRDNGVDMSLDGETLSGDVIPLVDDGQRHEVVVRSRSSVLAKVSDP